MGQFYKSYFEDCNQVVECMSCFKDILNPTQENFYGLQLEFQGKSDPEFVCSSECRERVELMDYYGGAGD